MLPVRNLLLVPVGDRWVPALAVTMRLIGKSAVSDSLEKYQAH
tara:strand:+ start:9557 stop:9685 length:129 start_codon:yes stop_codon:yes gene_type:complete